MEPAATPPCNATQTRCRNATSKIRKTRTPRSATRPSCANARNSRRPSPCCKGSRSKTPRTRKFSAPTARRWPTPDACRRRRMCCRGPIRPIIPTGRSSQPKAPSPTGSATTPPRGAITTRRSKSCPANPACCRTWGSPTPSPRSCRKPNRRCGRRRKARAPTRGCVRTCRWFCRWKANTPRPSNLAPATPRQNRPPPTSTPSSAWPLNRTRGATCAASTKRKPRP